MTFTARQRRFAVAVCAVLATSAGAAASAYAQAWPNKPITLIVPFPAGGTTDVLARSLAEPLAKALGQPVIVESKPGAGATIGADIDFFYDAIQVPGDAPRLNNENSGSH